MERRRTHLAVKQCFQTGQFWQKWYKMPKLKNLNEPFLLIFRHDLTSIEKNKSSNERNFLLDLSWAQWTFLLTSRALGSSKRPHSSSSSIRHLPEKISFESLCLILNIARILDPKSKRLNSSLSSIPHMPQKPSFESLISRDIGTKVQKAQSTNTRSDLQKYWRQNKRLF